MHAPISHQTSNFLLEIPQHAGGSGQLSMEVCSCHNYDVTDVSIPVSALIQTLPALQGIGGWYYGFHYIPPSNGLTSHYPHFLQWLVGV